MVIRGDIPLIFVIAYSSDGDLVPGDPLGSAERARATYSTQMGTEVTVHSASASGVDNYEMNGFEVVRFALEAPNLPEGQPNLVLVYGLMGEPEPMVLAVMSRDDWWDQTWSVGDALMNGVHRGHIEAAVESGIPVFVWPVGIAGLLLVALLVAYKRRRTPLQTGAALKSRVANPQDDTPTQS